MTAPEPPRFGVDEALQRATAIVAAGGRLLGIAGPPGAGKSTLAERLVEKWGPGAQLLPMDGFHLRQAELERLGRAQRKGAPDTFDVAAYVATLAEVRAGVTDVAVPAFDRHVEEPVPDAIVIPAAAELVVTEGNYLLLDEGPWRDVRPLLDACWWVEVDPTVRRERLVARHQAHGRTGAAARAWVEAVDEPNAELVRTQRIAPDAVVHVD